MPQLDVSWVLSDPMLADVMKVTRRTDVVGANGRTTPTPVEVFAPVTCVVTQQNPAELMRRDDSQSVPRRIFVAARFPFRAATRSQDGARQYQPDQILWPCGPGGEAVVGSTLYTVEEVYPYSRYGAGFHECVAASQQAVDPEQ